MKPAARDVLQALLRHKPGAAEDSASIAARVTEEFQLLANRVTRLVGALGVQALFSRAFYLAGATARMHHAADQRADPFDALRISLSAEHSDAIVIHAAVLLDELVRLLERFIGHSLVASLLHETWPEIFMASKE